MLLHLSPILLCSLFFFSVSLFAPPLYALDHCFASYNCYIVCFGFAVHFFFCVSCLILLLVLLWLLYDFVFIFFLFFICLLECRIRFIFTVWFNVILCVRLWMCTVVHSRTSEFTLFFYCYHHYFLLLLFVRWIHC